MLQKRGLIKWARSLTFCANIHVCLWVEIVNTTNYLINLFPTKTSGGLDPHHQLFGTLLDFCHLRVFGYVSFLHINPYIAKWSCKSLCSLWLVYGFTSKGYYFFQHGKKCYCVQLGCHFLWRSPWFSTNYYDSPNYCWFLMQISFSLLHLIFLHHQMY